MGWYPERIESREIAGSGGKGAIDKSYIAHLVASPALGTNVAVLAATNLADGATTEVGPDTQPDCPRILSVDGNAAGIAGNVVITGTNANDQAITDTIALNATTEVFGVKAFKTVNTITLPAFTNDANDTVSVGVGDKIGLSHEGAHHLVLATYLDNTIEGTAPTVISDVDEVEKCTADLNSALDGTQVDLYYVA